MATIREENQKLLRQPLKVECGMSVKLDDINEISIIGGGYDNYAGDVSEQVATPIYMDLSNGGFVNDGFAVPLEEEHPGIISRIAPLTLVVYMDNPEEVPPIVTIIGTEDGVLKTWRFTRQVCQIPGYTRKIITHIVIGYAWQFDNSNLISCDVQLRGVETTCDNPSLQMSEIEIKGYEPNDITDVISQLGENYPIWYTSGYLGDMSEIRRFYLDGQISWIDKVITIRGVDATKFLDKEFAGTYLGNTSAIMTGGLNQLFSTYNSMIASAGVDAEYTNELLNEAYFNNRCDAIYLPKKSIRELIAQASNLFKLDETATDSGFNMQFNYVDAGRPKLTISKRIADAVETIDNIGELEITSEPQIKEIRINAPLTFVNASASIKTDTIQGTVFEELSEPYYSFTASAGTITRLSPTTYKLKSTTQRSITVSGRKITLYDPTDDGSKTPFIYLRRDEHREALANGRTIELNDFYGFEGIWDTSETVTEQLWAICNQMAAVSPITYKFKWRGNPHLQPRDHINVIINGSAVKMTIDTMTLEHENGGLVSQITARKGWI